MSATQTFRFSIQYISQDPDNRLPTHVRVRTFLESVAKRRILITYRALAEALQILPPHSIHRVTEALERLMEEDAAVGRSFIAALAISKARGGLPAPGFRVFTQPGPKADMWPRLLRL